MMFPDAWPEYINNLSSQSRNHPDLFITTAYLVQSDNETLSTVVQTS